MPCVHMYVQHSDEDQVIGLRIDACLNHGDPTSWSSFLRSSGLVERETLNHVARCGSGGVLVVYVRHTLHHGVVALLSL